MSARFVPQRHERAESECGAVQYPWTVIRVEQHHSYMAALEKASVPARHRRVYALCGCGNVSLSKIERTEALERIDISQRRSGCVTFLKAGEGGRPAGREPLAGRRGPASRRIPALAAAGRGCRALRGCVLQNISSPWCTHWRLTKSESATW